MVPVMGGLPCRRGQLAGSRDQARCVDRVTAVQLQPCMCVVPALGFTVVPEPQRGAGGDTGVALGPTCQHGTTHF